MENQPLDSSMNNQQNLPNSIGVLVLGILSIVFCFCYGIIGITLGIISLVLANKAIKVYMNAPETYSESSYKNVKAGKICAIVGLCLSSLWIIYIIVIVALGLTAVGGGLLQGLGGY